MSLVSTCACCRAEVQAEEEEEERRHEEEQDAAASGAASSSQRSRADSLDAGDAPTAAPQQPNADAAADASAPFAPSSIPLCSLDSPPVPPLTPARRGGGTAGGPGGSSSSSSSSSSVSAAAASFFGGLSLRRLSAGGSETDLQPPGTIRKSSSRKRTYSYGASPHLSPSLTAQQTPSHSRLLSHPASPAGGPRSARKLEFDGADESSQPSSTTDEDAATVDSVAAATTTAAATVATAPSGPPPPHPPHHAHFSDSATFLLPPPSSAVSSQRSRGSRSQKMVAAASSAPLSSHLSHLSLVDPLPLSASEVLLEEEEEDESDSVVEEAGEQRQWIGIRNIMAQLGLLMQLAWRLTSVLGMSAKWMKMLGRLIGFAIALAPAWVIIGRTYFNAKFIKRGVRYGLNARNFLDLYLPHITTHTHVATPSPQSSTEEGMCQHHRNQAELHNLQQTATRHALSITDRLHLDSLLRVIAGPDAGRGIDLNAMREMADVAAAAKQTKEANKEEKAAAFASALTSHAMDVAPTSTTTAAAAGAAPITPLRVRTSSSASSSSSSSLFSPGAARSSATPSSFTSSSSPPAARPLVPVVIFITGGAWSIGYKAWGALLGLGLSAHGVLVASADYRNFPQGDIESMLLDVQTAITWVFRHIETYGGDPARIFLVGQSAGAHLGALAVLNNCEQLLSGKRTSWTAQKLRGFIGISGPYDLPHIKNHLHTRGLPLWVFLKMMRAKGDEELAKYSPARLAQQPWLAQHMRGGAKAKPGGLPARDRLLPPFLLIHGKGDKTVHWQGTDHFARCLHAAHVPVVVRYYKAYSHTDPIIEGPLTGHDHLCHDVLSFIAQQCEQHRAAQVLLQNHQRIRANSSATPYLSPDSMMRSRSSSNCSNSSVGAGATAPSPLLAMAASSSSSRLLNNFISPPPLTSAKPNGGLCHPAPTTPFRGGLAHRKSSTATALTEEERAAAAAADDGEEEDVSAATGETMHLLSPSPESSASPSTFSSLVHSLTLPLGMLPSFMRPGGDACIEGAGKVRRQASHLPHPFHLIDDVNESCTDDDDYERGQEEIEEAADVASTAADEAEAAGDGAQQPSNLSPPSQLQPFDADYIAALATSSEIEVDQRSWPVRLLADVWSSLVQLVPSVLSSVGVALAKPFVKLVRASPPPPQTESSAVASSSAAAAATNGEVNGKPTSVKPTSSSSSSTRPPRYSYPLQAASQLPHTPPRPLIPRFLIRCARWINPF